jgi:hypothetical protein
VAASESASALVAFLFCIDASQLLTGTLRSVVKCHLALHLDPAIEEDGLDGGSEGGGEEVVVLREDIPVVLHMVYTPEFFFFARADGLTAQDLVSILFV